MEAWNTGVFILAFIGCGFRKNRKLNQRSLPRHQLYAAAAFLVVYMSQSARTCFHRLWEKKHGEIYPPATGKCLSEEYQFVFSHPTNDSACPNLVRRSSCSGEMACERGEAPAPEERGWQQCGTSPRHRRHTSPTPPAAHLCGLGPRSSSSGTKPRIFHEGNRAK